MQQPAASWRMWLWSAPPNGSCDASENPVVIVAASDCRWMDTLYQLNASLPLPSGPSMPNGVPGNLNLTAHFQAGLGGTTGDVLPSAYTIDWATGASYMFQLHPLVESVAPAAGALQGATSGPARAERLLPSVR